MSETTGPTTPVALVEEVYGRYPERVAVGRRRLGRPLTYAAEVLFAHAEDPHTIGLDRGVDYADYRPDRGPPARRGAHHGALRPPDPGPGRLRDRPEERGRRQLRGLRVPAHGLGEVRHRSLEAGLGAQPPSGARAVRLPGR